MTSSPQECDRGTETILLAEDDAGVRDVCKSILSREGYLVLSAGTPGEALSLAKDYPGEIHLLLTDILMPEMSGGELFEKIQFYRPRIRSLFMSGYAAEFVSDMLSSGMTFLHKPFSAQGLGEKVREALGRKETSVAGAVTRVPD